MSEKDFFVIKFVLLAIVYICLPFFFGINLSGLSLVLLLKWYKPGINLTGFKNLSGLSSILLLKWYKPGINLTGFKNLSGLSSILLLH